MKISLAKNIAALQAAAKAGVDQRTRHPDIHALKLQQAVQHLAGEVSDYIVAEAKIRQTHADKLAHSIIANHKSRKLDPLLAAELERQIAVAEIRNITDANTLENMAITNPFIS